MGVSSLLHTTTPYRVAIARCAAGTGKGELRIVNLGLLFLGYVFLVTLFTARITLEQFSPPLANRRGMAWKLQHGGFKNENVCHKGSQRRFMRLGLPWERGVTVPMGCFPVPLGASLRLPILHINRADPRTIKKKLKNGKKKKISRSEKLRTKNGKHRKTHEGKGYQLVNLTPLPFRTRGWSPQRRCLQTSTQGCPIFCSASA